MKVSIDDIRYITIGSKRLTATITNYGCTLLSLNVNMPNGSTKDVVLGYEDITDYFDNAPCFGSCVLPNANRIADASYTLNNVTYALDANDGNNNLHSGYNALHKRLWDIVSYDDTSIDLALKCLDLDCGFPGNREYTVTYSIIEDKLLIEYTCISDKDTVFNPTNHSYFNLMGHDSGDILSHKLIINATTYTPSDKESICHGDVLPVANTPMDFTTPHTIGSRINQDYNQLIWGNGYDHNYILDKTYTSKNDLIKDILDDNLKLPSAILISPDESLTLNIYTTMPGLQLYTGNYLSSNDCGKGNHRYSPRCGVALETQYAPNAIKSGISPKPILSSGKKGYSATCYEFR